MAATALAATTIATTTATTKQWYRQQQCQFISSNACFVMASVMLMYVMETRRLNAHLNDVAREFPTPLAHRG